MEWVVVGRYTAQFQTGVATTTGDETGNSAACTAPLTARVAKPIIVANDVLIKSIESI